MGRVAMLLANDFEDSEARIPLERLRAAGHEVEIIGVHAGENLEGKNGTFSVDTDSAVVDCLPEDYDALVIPGGHSPDYLRIDNDMVSFVKMFGALGRPIAAVCHGPQLLIEADLVQGKTMTAWPSVRTDLRNAGADVVDREVVADGNIITSRRPEDLEAFSNCLVYRLDEAGDDDRLGTAAPPPQPLA